MDLNTIADTLLNNSPAWAIVAWFLFRMENLIQRNTEALAMMAGVIQRCKKKENEVS